MKASQAQPHFYIQLVYKSHFGILNSSVWAVWAAQGSKEKINLSISYLLLRMVFSKLS